MSMLAGAPAAATAQELDAQQAQALQQAAQSSMGATGVGSAMFGSGARMGVNGSAAPMGPVTLGPGQFTGGATVAPSGAVTGSNSVPPAYVAGEFERFVNKVAGNDAPEGDSALGPRDQLTPTKPKAEKQWIRRLGADLISASPSPGQDFSPQVPPDYLISPGDEIVLTLWGSVDANLRLTVDRSGRVTIPRVGAVMVSGVRYADLASVLKRGIGEVFRNFQLSVSLGQLRSIRIYVTGFALQPGSYTVSSLSTIVNALMQTGGPSSAGSFRNIELHRNGKVVTDFDLYDLLLRGDTSADRVLQAEDVIDIGPVGRQVALIGSVNRPAIFELKPTDTVADVIRMAAGFTPVADQTRLAMEALADRPSLLVKQLALPADEGMHPNNGDILRAFSLVDPKQPTQRQNKHVLVQGEVQRPGDYILPPDSTLNDAIAAAGGLTKGAFLYGTDFDRVSVRETQQENYDRALRDMETAYTRMSAGDTAISADEVAQQKASSANAEKLIAELKAVKPTGRVVLQIGPNERKLPDLALEDGDTLYVPPKPTTVGVFGSVFNGGSYLFEEDLSLDGYLRMSGGATADADSDSVFVVRANGTVVSNRQGSGWFGLASGLGQLRAQPGDTIFVPSKFDRRSFIRDAKDWTQILYQFGLGLAGLKTLR